MKVIFSLVFILLQIIQGFSQVNDVTMGNSGGVSGGSAAYWFGRGPRNFIYNGNFNSSGGTTNCTWQSYASTANGSISWNQGSAQKTPIGIPP